MRQSDAARKSPQPRVGRRKRCGGVWLCAAGRHISHRLDGDAPRAVPQRGHRRAPNQRLPRNPKALRRRAEYDGAARMLRSCARRDAKTPRAVPIFKHRMTAATLIKIPSLGRTDAADDRLHIRECVVTHRTRQRRRRRVRCDRGQRRRHFPWQSALIVAAQDRLSTTRIVIAENLATQQFCCWDDFGAD
jgi:hypothetical protein